MNSNSVIKALNQMIKVNSGNKLPTITPDFSYLPTLEMVEYNTPDHIKNYDIDFSCLTEN